MLSQLTTGRPLAAETSRDEFNASRTLGSRSELATTLSAWIPYLAKRRHWALSTTWGAGESRTASRREMYSISEVVATPMRAPVITGAEYKFSTLPTEQEGDTRTSPVSFRILSESGNHSRFQTRPSESTPILA